MANTTHEFVHNGNTLHYTQSGAGEPVIMLHNGGASKEIWTDQVEGLRDRHEVFCLDLLGYGESDIPASGFLITDYVDTLEAFIDHLGGERVSVVSNCMGSAMTLLLAARRPELFKALVLINPLTYQTARNGVAGWALNIVTRFPTLTSAIARRVRVPRFASLLVVVAQFGPRHWWRGLRHPSPHSKVVGATWTRKGRLAALAGLFSDLTAFEALDHLRPGPDFPSFAVIWGASNLGLSPKAGAALNTTLTPERAYSLPGCGHLPMMEAPEEVTRIIGEFLGS